MDVIEGTIEGVTDENILEPNDKVVLGLELGSIDGDVFGT